MVNTFFIQNFSLFLRLSSAMIMMFTTAIQAITEILDPCLDPLVQWCRIEIIYFIMIIWFVSYDDRNLLATFSGARLADWNRVVFDLNKFWGKLSKKDQIFNIDFEPALNRFSVRSRSIWKIWMTLAFAVQPKLMCAH